MDSLLISRKVRAYIGYEPSSRLHLGSLIAALPVLSLAKQGHTGVFLMADLHARLNHKGTLEAIRGWASENFRILKALCYALEIEPRNLQFRLGSEFQLSPEYFVNVLELSQVLPISQTRRSMDQISRKLEDARVSSEIYPLMQAIDIVALDCNVATGGLDQRKIHVMAREYLPKLGLTVPVCIHTPMVHGLDGGTKMSKSLGNSISILDTGEDIRKKIEAAFCPPRAVEGNPLIELVDHLILRLHDKITVDGIEFTSGIPLKEKWAGGQIHPRSLKAAIANEIVSITDSIKEQIQYIDNVGGEQYDSPDEPSLVKGARGG
jgi:tyrosyl-tRNA synthetase